MICLLLWRNTDVGSVAAHWESRDAR